MTIVMTVVRNLNRGRPRSELRAVIFKAAIRLFRKHGYAVTTVDEIVAAARVAKGTFFNFFPTKLDVLKDYYAAIDSEVARCRVNMDATVPLKSLSNYASDVEAILLREGALIFELLDLAVRDQVMSRIDAESGARDSDEFATFLLEARIRGIIANHVDPKAASRAIVDLWSGAVRTWLINPEKGSLAQLFDLRVRMLFEGLGYKR